MRFVRRRQLGYLYEMPLLLLLTIILASVLFPFLDAPWNSMALALPGVAFVILIIYSWRRRR